jgi:hypothetical protein
MDELVEQWLDYHSERLNRMEAGTSKTSKRFLSLFSKAGRSDEL